MTIETHSYGEQYAKDFLIQSGLSPIAIGDAMNSRLADLSDTIDISDLI